MGPEASRGGSTDVASSVRHAWKELPDKPYAVLGLLLSFVGGFADAGSYVLAGSFTGHLTGNTVLAAVHLVHHDWQPALSCVVAIAAFLVGTAAGINWPDPPGRSACRRLAGPVAAEIILVGAGLLAAVALGPGGKAGFLATLCLALGLQNGALGRIEGVEFHTTFITGLATTLLTSLAAGKPDPKRTVLPPIIGCFVVGALCGAVAVSRFDAPGFGLVFLPLAGAWSLATRDRRR